MQTFVPYNNFEMIAKCLDRQRLGKQRIEAWQIYQALTIPNYGWRHHPIVKMWKGFEGALLIYGARMCTEWIERGYKDTMRDKFIAEILSHNYDMTIPWWFNNQALRESHQSNLVRKLPSHYRKYFPDIPDNLSYIWFK